MRERIVRPLRQRSLQASLSLVVALCAGVREAAQTKGFRMFARQFERSMQCLSRSGFLAIANGPGRRLQVLHSRRRQAVETQLEPLA